MTEQQGPADEIVERLLQRPRPAAQGFPELRLRSDVPVLEIDEATPVSDALTQLQSEDIGVVALRKPDGEPAAVVVSVERYFELVSKELASDDKLVAAAGRILPQGSALKSAYVELVNPDETWE